MATLRLTGAAKKRLQHPRKVALTLTSGTASARVTLKR